MAKVLVVDDEPIVRDVVSRYLRRDGFEILEAGSGEDAQRILEAESPALVVLDVMLPGISGLDLCQRIRGSSTTPVILLSARGEEADRIVGLELGADDYVTKPFSPRELAVRVRNVLKRSASLPPPVSTHSFGAVEIDGDAREVHKGGERLKLTSREFELLVYLVSHPRRVFSRDQLMDSVWGYSAAVDTGTVTVHIRRLREKIEDDPAHPRYLETVWGLGYRFTP